MPGLIISNNALTAEDNVITTNNSDTVRVNEYDRISFHSVVTVNTPGADTIAAGEAEINTVTFETQTNSDDGDFVVVTDTAGLEWAVALDKTGSSPEPSASEWTSIPAGRKAQADISGDSTAADVADAVETAFNGISGFSAVVTTDDTAADGTMTFTQVIRGPVADVATYQDDGAASDISVAESNAGVASAVDASADTITISSHGYTTGLVGQFSSTATLPGGLSTSTNYYVIVVDSDTIQVATSLANALASTQVNITNQGTDGATHTFTPTSLAGAYLQLQNSPDESNWYNVGGQVPVSASGTFILPQSYVEYRYARVQSTLTSGRMSIATQFIGETVRD